VFEFGEIMHIRPFPDGRPMLRAMQADSRLLKTPTDNVIMTPTPNANIPLTDLNVLIAEQKNCSIDELCNFVSGAPSGKSEIKEVAQVKEMPAETAAPVRAQAKDNAVLSDKDIAKSMRSQADSLYKEAARLRKEADVLDPIQKKTKKTEEIADA
jgi:hypothetical protein